MTYDIIANRQMKRIKSMQQSKIPRRCELQGIFLSFGRGDLSLRLTTSCYFPSSHLQIQWQAIPAMMEMINEENKSIQQHPLPAPVWGRQLRYYIIKGSFCDKKQYESTTNLCGSLLTEIEWYFIIKKGAKTY